MLPTLLAVAGATPSAAAMINGPIDGVSQWGVISAGESAVRSGFIYNIDPCAYNTANYSNFSAIRQGDWKYIDGVVSPADRWQPLPVHAHGSTQPLQATSMVSTGPWLFNVIDDPNEHSNLLAFEPTKAAELKAALDAAATEAVRPFNCEGSPGAVNVPLNVSCPGGVWTPWVS